MVGSGKSTITKHVVDVLSSEGIDAQLVRFRALGPFATLTPGRAASRAESPAPTTRRFTGFRLRALTARRTLGYLFKMLWFRVMGPARQPVTLVFDRYFYDSLAHYTLRSWPERVYLAMLRLMMPKPDLAIALIPSAEVAASRRPDYDANYIVLAGEGYRRLSKEFSELIQINTDPGEAALDRVTSVLKQSLAGSRARHGRPQVITGSRGEQ